eukprot:TRINITY_DN8222_c0_g2_i1.p1 TRINITY_DN8222_c0_g2~~TRINITY_DN8222_c0_g2_i1.p1  ORF type:complete len:310 (-),score=65.62 TRINITY_DN8222_c0_g2_i1:336-1265(-)
MPGGSVRNLLDKFGPLDEKIIKIYMRQILKGLKYLHSNNIIHNNLKCSNILVANEGTIKISDFAVVKCASTFELSLKPSKENTCENTDRAMVSESASNSLYWMAPEVIENATASKAADIWSLGCLMFEMSTGSPPWAQSASDPEKVLRRILKSPNGPELPSDVLSLPARSWLCRCFERRPEKRPTVEELLDDPFITCIDEAADLQAKQLAKRISLHLEEDFLMNNEIIIEESKAIANSKSHPVLRIPRMNSIIIKQDPITKKKLTEVNKLAKVQVSAADNAEAKAKEQRRKMWEEALRQELERRRLQTT